MSSPPPGTSPGSSRSRRAVWLCAVLGLGLSAAGLWLAGRPARNTADGQPESGVPPELAALGDDPDGDGTTTADELRAGMNPLVADVPDVQVSFDEIEFGLRVNAIALTSADDFRVWTRDRLDSGHAVQTAGIELSGTETTSATGYAGGLGVGAGRYAVPLSYVGRHDRRELSTLTHSYSAFAVTAERLDVVKRNVTRRMEDRAAQQIDARAGYFKGRARVFGSHACSLEDFGVNVRVNGQIRWTVPATRDPNFRPLRVGTAPGTVESIVLHFDGFNTQEIREHLLPADGAKGGVAVAFEVPSATVRLSEYADPGVYSKRLAAVRGRCAQVEVVSGGKRASYHISTAAGADRNEIRLDELLGRLPAPAPPVWARGVSGDYLKEVRGQPALDALDPDRPADGMWCVFHDGEELSGEWRGRAVRPGAHLRLIHTTSREYWGVGEWAGYTACHQRLLDVQGREHDFWAELDSFDIAAPPKPFDALAEKNVAAQAVRLRDLYRALLKEPLPPVAGRLYPRLGRLRHHLEVFEQWFTNGPGLGFRAIQTVQVELTGARIWWNVNNEFKAPEATVTVRRNGVDEVVTSVGFTVDAGGQSGRFRFPAMNRLGWSPFDEVVLRVRVGGTDVVNVTYGAYRSLAGLFQTHPLAVAGADPQLAGFEVTGTVRHGDREVPSGTASDVLGWLNEARPRVIPVVPAELYPERLALDGMALHHPVAYYRAGVLFEDLYRTEKADPARYRRLARAIQANFRASCYRRCAALAGELPGDKDLAPETLALFPPKATPSSLRGLGAVAAEADRLPRDGEDIGLLRRVTGLRNSAYRLHQLASGPLRRNGLDTAEARKWRDALAAGVGRERAELARCRAPLVHEYLRTTLHELDTDLQTMAQELSR